MDATNISNMTVTGIQFFDCTRQIQVGEDEFETVKEYSANVIFDGSFVVQLSGNDNESHAPTIPHPNECYYNDENLQAEVCYQLVGGELDINDVENALDSNGIENNFYYLQENGETM